MLLRDDPLSSYRAQPKAKLKVVPAPSGGWNTRDALSQMDPRDAVALDNFFPTVSAVVLRNGFDSYATGLGATVETLLEYHSGSTRKFIAAANNNFWDISAAGAASSLASGLTNSRWQGVMFNTKLHMANGADAPRTYDGSAIATPAWSGSGLTTTNLVGVTVYRERLIFWENASQDWWYGGVQSVSGTLTKFPMSMLGRLGGNIALITPWARQLGDSTQEVLAILMTSGEVALYYGTDPGVADSWTLLDIPTIPIPIHRRGVVKIGGDVMILTNDGWISLGDMITKGRAAHKHSKIHGAADEAARTYGSNFGWTICHYPLGHMVLVNVPVSSARFDQHVLNTDTGAWCRFTGMNGSSWATYNDELYFGGTDGVVYKADTGTDDNGANIAAEAQPAWNHFGLAQPKLMVGFRPIIECTGTLTLSFGFGYDFKTIAVSQTASSVAEGPTWDTATWDDEYWAPEANIRSDQYDAAGEGTHIGLRMRYLGKGQELSWHRTDFWLTPAWAL